MHTRPGLLREILKWNGIKSMPTAQKIQKRANCNLKIGEQKVKSAIWYKINLHKHDLMQRRLVLNYLPSTQSLLADSIPIIVLIVYPELIKTIIMKAIGIIMLNCNKFIIM